MDMDERNGRLRLVVGPGADPETARRLVEELDTGPAGEEGLTLRLDGEGLALVCGEQVLMGDFARMLPRLQSGRLPGELLVRAAKIKDPDHPLTAVDATAGLGEDSLLLAAAGFRVRLFERNPVVYALLADAVRRAAGIPELAGAVGRMELCCGDSIQGMKGLESPPDVILLDPMFPARQKSALVKKKLQVIQKLELPCADEAELLRTAMEAAPKKLIIKRPPKGPFLAGVKPDYPIAGKAVRFDCIVEPYQKMHKYKL